MPPVDDQRWVVAAAALAERARPLSRPNPGVGAIVLKEGRVVGRGWTRFGGRPHAEAMALEKAGSAAHGATLYVTLEPCMHRSARGPACADLVVEAGLARVVVGMCDPDPRTAGAGLATLAESGVEVAQMGLQASRLSLSGHEMFQRHGRPHVTLKLALTLDGRLAMPDGSSRWITGPEARAHVHRERARADAILVGGETLRSDTPSLDVRLQGLEDRSPERWVLTRGPAPGGWKVLASPERAHSMPGVRYLFIEGGAGAAASFLRADMVDRLLIYRAPILLGDGRPALGDIGLTDLNDAHDRWRREDIRPLGRDTLEVYIRSRQEG
ncbi:bifunctional diaminohydroxyphosphoribosylaminopyrimidine deaminase/5-amino-6-(5-phosphoribosylamino)uracil reductase RibD [Aurantiacibacter spongiae]|uniref:Riboflavin biosynthesis protein RibD n=1 Tax=Aurantiacibacter spongiae TaxID=2488860 RepID=A0A3N5CUB0_9SPHN|nr:bifunctional diaminohydroxyphosphoribosylaminopyrimidine deaminase/5-amino-6-(5-phosphoribosylamino)uracil reductase RibD [Aurantiacibacter spongiae]RPF71010.1 bifunctional diaminohydroxyphosphoribosylaminopyrimidine deaminase/5-amino-6-(5-phosphoribosylamino)uracil reductase RibD [Aurantiacibacter spongiae]